MTITSTRFALATAAALLLAATGASYADTVKLSAPLQPDAEVPPVKDTKASGKLEGTYDTATKVLTYTATYSDLTGPASAAHFHAPAPAGKNSGVEIPITGPLASPIKGQKTLTDDEAKNLMDGDTYFNIHTAKNPKGEMRGQVAIGK